MVCSDAWNNGGGPWMGAATWGNGASGVTGTVSAANSLVGTDAVGAGGVWALTNGNYVVVSSEWHNSAMAGAGAVTWGDGATGLTGTVSITNSLVGSSANDQIGYGSVTGGITALANGNYVVISPEWHHGAMAGAGAVTLGDGLGGTTGLVTGGNSVLGGTGGGGTFLNDAYDYADDQLVVGRPQENLVTFFIAAPAYQVYLPDVRR